MGIIAPCLGQRKSVFHVGFFVFFVFYYSVTLLTSYMCMSISKGCKRSLAEWNTGLLACSRHDLGCFHDRCILLIQPYTYSVYKLATLRWLCGSRSHMDLPDTSISFTVARTTIVMLPSTSTLLNVLVPSTLWAGPLILTAVLFSCGRYWFHNSVILSKSFSWCINDPII